MVVLPVGDSVGSDGDSTEGSIVRRSDGTKNGSISPKVQ